MANVKLNFGPHEDESVGYSVESFIKPHEIDNSAAIFSAQKIREVNFKQRKRKVDQEPKESFDKYLEDNDGYDMPQPQEPKSDERYERELYEDKTNSHKTSGVI
mmetsp:Transcript_32475/g.37026  ORF Transcript_32475/g.37026 Transcript_32475/m.37026 type:complete len:104 (-) Transcript_32475:160-471(-)